MDMRVRRLVLSGGCGRVFEMREENGEDEEIMRKGVDWKNVMNVRKYIWGIVVKRNGSKWGRLRIEDGVKLGLVDR